MLRSAGGVCIDPSETKRPLSPGYPISAYSRPVQRASEEQGVERRLFRGEKKERKRIREEINREERERGRERNYRGGRYVLKFIMRYNLTCRR